MDFDSLDDWEDAVEQYEQMLLEEWAEEDAPRRPSVDIKPSPGYL